MNERDRVIKELRKEFQSIIPDSDTIEPDEVRVLSSGIPQLDKIMGGGYPRGQITHIWGPDGGGKTTSMIPTVISAQEQPRINGVTLYIATEPKVDESIFYRQGVDPEKMIFAKTREKDNPLDGNKAINMVREALGEVDLIIVDSVAGLTPGVVYEMQSEDYAIGKIAALLSSQFPIVASTLAATDTVLIMLNQQRSNFGVQKGPKTKPFAGYALTHWVAVRIVMRKRGFVYSDNMCVGYEAFARVEKHDFFPPRGEAQWIMNFEVGIDKVTALWEAAKDLKVIRYGGGWKMGDVSLNYPGGKNAEDAISRLRAEPDLLQALEDAVTANM
jgi:recombination protein RecA